MSVLIRLLLIISAVLMLIFMLKKIRQAKLKIEYVIFWVVFSVILVIMGIFPGVLYAISDFIGFQSPINMVYLVIIFVLIVKMFFMTLQISQLEYKTEALTQQIAIDRKITQEEKEKTDQEE